MAPKSKNLNKPSQLPYDFYFNVSSTILDEHRENICSSSTDEAQLVGQPLVNGDT